jgi:hypothetical protein
LVVDLALFVSKRLMPVACALLLLAAARLAFSQATPGSASPSKAECMIAQSSQVRVLIAH